MAIFRSVGFWVFVFIAFCFASWHMVESGLNAPLREEVKRLKDSNTVLTDENTRLQRSHDGLVKGVERFKKNVATSIAKIAPGKEKEIATAVEQSSKESLGDLGNAEAPAK